MCVRNTQARCLAAKPAWGARLMLIAAVLTAYITVIETFF